MTAAALQSAAAEAAMRRFASASDTVSATSAYTASINTNTTASGGATVSSAQELCNLDAVGGILMHTKPMLLRLTMASLPH